MFHHLQKIRLSAPQGCSVCRDEIIGELQAAPVEIAGLLALRGGRTVDSWRYSDGSVSDVTVDLDDVRRRLCESKATALWKAHNHPGAALAWPSKQDVRWVRELLRMLAAEKVRLADYAIVGKPGTEAFSLARATANEEYFGRMAEHYQRGMDAKLAPYARLLDLQAKGRELDRRMRQLEERWEVLAARHDGRGA